MIRVIPGGIGLREVLDAFSKNSVGIVTAFDDSALAVVRDLIDPEATIQIQPFGQIVRRITLSAGQEARPYAQDGHVEAAIANACEALSDLGPFLRGRRHPGIHRGIKSTLQLLAEWGVGPDEMDAMANECSPDLGTKLRALARIDRHATQTLFALGREGMHDQMFRLEWDMTVELEGGDTKMLVILSDDDEPGKVDFLEWLSLHGADITLIADRHPSNPEFFQTADRIAARLKIEPVAPGRPTHLQAALFAEPTTENKTLEVERLCVADPLSECEWALRSCVGRNAAIFVRDLTAYGPLLKAASDRFNVPIVATRKVSLISNAFVRIALAALEFCASNDVRTLIDVLPSSYLKLSSSQQTDLRSMLYEARKYRDLQWSTLSDSIAAKEETFPWLKFLLDWRTTATEKARDLREWNSMLIEFLESEQLPWSQKVAEGSIEMLERDVYARNQVQRSVAQRISIELQSETPALTFREFVLWLRPILESAEVAIPKLKYGVVVTTDPLSLSSFDEVYVMGMLEGTFPRRRSEDPILNDEERAEISAQLPEMPPLPDSRGKAMAERELFYRVCTAAKTKLTLSYPLTGDDRDNIPAYYLQEIADALSLREAVRIVRRTHLWDDDLLLDADVRLHNAFDQPPSSPAPVELELNSTRQLVKKDPLVGVRIVELRDALRCPFMSVARRRLDLQPRRSQTRWWRLRDLPRRAELARSGTTEELKDRLNLALDAELEEIYGQTPDWEMRLLESGGRRIIEDWVRREQRSREIWPKDPDSVKMHVSFGSADLRDKVTSQVKLEGSIAALSQFGSYKVAHVYDSVNASARELPDEAWMQLGAQMLALYERDKQVAVEVDSTGSTRTLYIINRVGNLPSDKDKIRVIDLSQHMQSNSPIEEFFTKAKELINAAADTIAAGTITPKPGDHCERCDFGELCRRSKQFSEIGGEAESEEAVNE